MQQQQKGPFQSVGRFVAKTVRRTTLAAMLVAAMSRDTEAQVASRIVSSSEVTNMTIATTPLTLSALLDGIRAGHPRIQGAEARVRAARGTRTTAGAWSNPMLALQVEKAPMAGDGAPMMERETMTMATLPLEPFYQRGPRVRAADAGVRAAQAELAATRQQLELDAAQAFYRVAIAQLRTDVANDVASWLDSVVAYNRARVAEGVAAGADLIRAQLEHDRAMAEATMQAADLARARAELSTFLDSPRASDTAGRRPLVVAVDDAPLLMPAGAGSAETRPRVVAARERFNAATSAVGIERRMIVPELGATIGTMTSAGSTSLVAGVSMPFPLFDQNRGEVARSRAERDAAENDLVAEVRNARADVAGAREAAQLLTDRATMLARADSGAVPAFLARADETRRIALGAYREGAVPLLSVIDAARAWGEARIAFFQLIFAQHESVLALLAAEGRDPAVAMPRAAAGARP